MAWPGHLARKRLFLILATIVWTIFLSGFLLDSKYYFGKIAESIVKSTSTNEPEQLAAVMGNVAPERMYPSSSALTDFIKASEESRLRFLEKRRVRIGSRKLSKISPGTSFWDFFPPTISCPFTTERIGRFGEGGKFVCGFEFLSKWPKSPKRPCIVYSFGVAGDSSFESEILDRTPCKVYGYDPTVSKMNLKIEKYPGRIFFSKVGLGAANSPTYHTLGELMSQNGHKWIDLLKVDIEFAEYPAFDQILQQFGDKLPFAHLNIEVHLRGVYDGKEFQKFFEWWTRLEDSGLRAYKLELNHICAKKAKAPVCMEVSFLNINKMY